MLRMATRSAMTLALVCGLTTLAVASDIRDNSAQEAHLKQDGTLRCTSSWTVDSKKQIYHYFDASGRESHTVVFTESGAELVHFESPTRRMWQSYKRVSANKTENGNQTYALTSMEILDGNGTTRARFSIDDLGKNVLAIEYFDTDGKSLEKVEKPTANLPPILLEASDDPFFGSKKSPK